MGRVNIQTGGTGVVTFNTEQPLLAIAEILAEISTNLSAINRKLDHLSVLDNIELRDFALKVAPVTDPDGDNSIASSLKDIAAWAKNNT